MHAGARAPRLSFRTRHDRPPFYLVDVPYCFPQVLERFGDDLPYLFKVLSVDTALSIQAHPDKSLAEQLHAERPHVYKDDNHKPEMAVALHDFSALSRFVSTEELKEALLSVPEIAIVVGQEAVSTYLQSQADKDAKDELKALYSKVVKASDDVVATAVTQLVGRLEAALATGHALSKKELLVLQLNKDYPLDVGILSVFFLNLMELQPGEAIALEANEPHAYLTGELMEVMATSDNVVRAGLTPKLKDADVLVEMLTYNQGPPEVMQGTQVRDYTYCYSPPMDEFQLERMDVPAGCVASIPAVPGPGMLLVQHGMAASLCGWKAGQLKRGDVFFVPANTEVQLQAKDSDLKLWVANVSCKVWEN
eukprot:CAMPEP_0117690242 /NCGR_PEP_ID=MMETSP0804-20121206/25014_1 /TAXON_ID=1074897 /ORGANISM="Tetraselmis astigmatica, Strain CCMP880" /LENGTH=364 /DNA_ID=CAMNT_0005503259 /DNA_START=237 /DNA_END=1331 /DNA_ORIENTATION=+